MDFAYLIRSGLGLPDYWHPHTEIHPESLTGEIGRYPFSVEGKADFPGELNEEGVPIIYLGGVARAHPITVVMFGLGSHDAFMATRNERYREQMMHVLAWMERHAVSLGDGIGWANENDIPAFGLKPPWFSAITQGFALSLFVRANQLDRNGPWARLSHQTWLGFNCPVEDGGFCRKVQDGVIYEEYPCAQLDCVFNGMCFALIGLWEAWRSGTVPEAEQSFKSGVAGFYQYLPDFDQNGWSRYSLNPCLGKPLLASPYYQRANALLAQIIGMISNESQFLIYGEKWLKASRSIIRRIGIFPPNLFQPLFEGKVLDSF